MKEMLSGKVVWIGRLTIIAIGGLAGFFSVGGAGGNFGDVAPATKKVSGTKEADSVTSPIVPVASSPEPDRALGGGNKKTKVERLREQFTQDNPFSSVTGTVLMPKSAVQSLSWDFGDVGTTCKLTGTTQRALRLSNPVKNSIEKEVDSFLQTVRDTEVKNIEVLENKGDSIMLYLPAGLKVTDALNRLEANITKIAGSDMAAILLPKLEREFESITPLIRGQERFIDVRLVGENGVEVSTSDRLANATSWNNYIPATMRHLVKVGEDNLRKK